MLSIDAIWDGAADESQLTWARAFSADMKHHSHGRAYLNFAGLGNAWVARSKLTERDRRSHQSSLRR